MPFKDPVARRAYQNARYAAKPRGRPLAKEGESMVVANDMLASANRPINGGVYFLPVDEIVKRQGWKTYKDMLHDDQVKTCLAFKKILIGGRTWELSPGEADTDKKVAKFVEWNLQRIDLPSVIREGLSAIEFGYSLGEIVFERTFYEGNQVVALKKIAHRDPQNIELAIDEHGNVIQAKQCAYYGARKDITLDPKYFWIYSHQKRFGDPYGVSDLRSAYRAWWAKKFIINFWNVFLERMGSPMTKITYPTGSSQELKDTLKRILTNLSSKTEVLVPEGVEIDLIEAQRSGNATYREALGFHNNAIANSLLMASLLGSGGEDNKTRGSDSQSFLHLRILFKMADDVSQALIKSFMDQVVRQVVEDNFDGDVDKLMPRFIWQDYGQFEGMKVADTIRLLHAAGIVDMDQKDVNYARSVLGLPLRMEGDKEDDVRRPPEAPPPGNANAPPPAAGQGNERAKKGSDTTNAQELLAAILLSGVGDAE